MSKSKARLFRKVLHKRVTQNNIIDRKSHEKVISIINRLNEIIPDKYSKYNITDIIMPKACGYHTGFDEKHNLYSYVKIFLRDFLISEKLANYIAFRILSLEKRHTHKALLNNREEMPIDRTDTGESIDKYKLDRSQEYNMFFANMQTYLRVMVLYIRKDFSHNNILVVPKWLRNVEILKQIDSNKVVFFDDFIGDEIFQEYIAAKDEFSSIYSENLSRLHDIFSMDGYSFLPIIKIGVENIFKYLIPQSILFCLTVEKLFKEINVRAVIGARVRKIYDRAFYICAKNNGIRRYTILHSSMGNHFRFIHSMGHFTDLDGVFVWGEKQKELIESDSFSLNTKVYVTGSPLFRRVRYDRNEKTSYNRKTILYAGTKDDFKEIRAILKSLKSVEIPTKVILKIHPGEDHQPYRRFCKNNAVKLVPGTEVLEDYLKYADILITTISESSLQSMIGDIPTLFIAIKGYIFGFLQSLYSFNKDEIRWLIAKSNNELRIKIKKLLTSKAYLKEHKKIQQSYLEKTIYLNSDPDYPVKKISDIINK